MKKILIDFDGVIHSYKSGWQGADVISDLPVEGAIDFLTRLVVSKELQPMIYSSRSKYPAGIKAMKEWLKVHGMDEDIIRQIDFPTKKPAAFLTIDDRCICFMGVFPKLSEIKNFKPWNKP